jgi:flagellar basal body-associated protein FliL
MISKKSKTLISVLVLIMLAAAGFYAWRVSSQKPECNCVFPNTKEYGVIKDDECVVTDCKLKSK